MGAQGHPHDPNRGCVDSRLNAILRHAFIRERRRRLRHEEPFATWHGNKPMPTVLTGPRVCKHLGGGASGNFKIGLCAFRADLWLTQFP